MRASFQSLRLRRLRQSSGIRDLIRETELNLRDLVLPLFIKRETGEKQPVASMPGHFQIPLSLLEQEIKEITSLNEDFSFKMLARINSLNFELQRKKN